MGLLSINNLFLSPGGNGRRRDRELIHGTVDFLRQSGRVAVAFVHESNPFSTRSTFALQALSIWDAAAGIATGDWGRVNRAYDNNTLGLTAGYANSEDVVDKYLGYYGTRAALTGAAVADVAAGVLIALDGLGISSIGEKQIFEWGGRDIFGKGSWLNSGKYIRIGWSRYHGNRVFRVGGKVVQWILRRHSWDIWKGGPL